MSAHATPGSTTCTACGAATARPFVQIADACSYYPLTLCDGTRTRAELAAAMSARFDFEVTPALVEASIADLGPRRVFSA